MKSFKDKKVNILFPISGLGKRFSDAGYNQPKPLIDVLGQSMIQWAVFSCDFLGQLKNYNLIFTVRKEHVEDFKIDASLKKIFGEAIKIIVIDTDVWPSGQAGHCLAAKDFINNDDYLFIYSCDTYSLSPVAEMIDQEDPDGILPCFVSTEPHFSYAKLDSAGYVCETAEKRQISNLATNGHYYFRRGSDFVIAVETMIREGESLNGEYYVAPCYNFLINKGRKIKVVMTKNNWVMGTPSELGYFIKNYHPNNI